MKEKLKEFFWNNRIGTAILFAIISVVLTFLFGGFCSIIVRDPSSFWDMSVISFLWFFAPVCVSSLLIIVTKIDESLAFGFGAGLYYGTIIIARIVEGFSNTLIGCIIASLICYAVYIVKFKQQ